MSNAVKEGAVGARVEQRRFIRELRIELLIGLITLGALAGTTLRVLHDSSAQSPSTSHLSGDCLEDWPPHA
jgi:hypothetical protein